MKLAERMIRLDDGMVGRVELVELPGNDIAEKRIVFVDRGERRIAGKAEKWVRAELPPRPLRAEEKTLIALYADRALRAYEKNEPLKIWEKPSPGDEPFDPLLIAAVVDYLSAREKAADTIR